MKKLLTLLTLLTSISSAWAYIPPSAYIMKQMAQKRATAKGLRLRTTVLGMQGKTPTAAHFKETTTIDFNERVLRSRAFDELGHELYSVIRKFDGGGNAIEGDPATVATRAELDPSYVSLIRGLKAAGVPVKSDLELKEVTDEQKRRAQEVQGLERWKGTIAWVIGNPARLSMKSAPEPQLWVEKDTFLPIRLFAKVSEGLMDVRFENYRFYKDFPVARLITVARAEAKPEALKEESDTTILRAELNDALVNPDLADIKPQTPAGWTDAGNSADGAVRDLIRQYYGVIR